MKILKYKMVKMKTAPKFETQMSTIEFNFVPMQSCELEEVASHKPTIMTCTVWGAKLSGSYAQATF